jgi:hypothetical protein
MMVVRGLLLGVAVASLVSGITVGATTGEWPPAPLILACVCLVVEWVLGRWSP